MEDDEIIVINHNASINNQKNNNKKKKKKKAVKKTASNKIAKMDKKEVRAFNKINKNTKKKDKLKVTFIIIVFIVALILILMSDLFNVKNIDVRGNSTLSKEEVISLSGIQKETNIFSISKKKVKEQLKEEAYIEKSKVSFKLPNTIEIEITERVPKYMLQFADSFVYINNQGYMLEITNEPLEIPILVGFVTDLSNIHPGSRMDIEDLTKMEKVIKIMEVAKNNDIANLITKIDISDEHNYTLILDTEGKKAYLGDISEINTKVLLLKKILELETGKSGEVFLNIDINTEDPYFRESVNV